MGSVLLGREYGPAGEGAPHSLTDSFNRAAGRGQKVSERACAGGARRYDALMSEIAPLPALLDHTCIAEIRQLERKIGRTDLLGEFIRNLEHNLEGFRGAYRDCLERGDAKGATRAAHTLKGSCLQLGAQALGGLFEEIERCSKAGDHAGALRTLDHAADLISESLAALKSA